MKILILGHGRHGKDTVAEILRDEFGMTFISSSEAAASAIFPVIRAATGAESPAQAFAERHQHRELWRQAICDYNEGDKARLCREILQTTDVYVGMRAMDEYLAGRELFDLVLYVEAFDRCAYLDPTMGIDYDPESMVLVSNNGSIEELKSVVTQLAQLFKLKTIPTNGSCKPLVMGDNYSTKTTTPE